MITNFGGINHFHCGAVSRGHNWRDRPLSTGSRSIGISMKPLTAADYLRYTVPPFITNTTRFSTLISFVGSPGTAITSAK